MSMHYNERNLSWELPFFKSAELNKALQTTRRGQIKESFFVVDYLNRSTSEFSAIERQRTIKHGNEYDGEWIQAHREKEQKYRQRGWNEGITCKIALIK